MDRHLRDDGGEDESGDTKEADQSKHTRQSKQTKSENNRKIHDISYRAEMNSQDSQEHLKDVEKCNGEPPSEKLLSSEAGVGEAGVGEGEAGVGEGEAGVGEDEAGVGEAGADWKGDDEEKAGQSSHPGIPVDRGWAWVIMMAQFVLTLLMVGYGRALSIFFLEFIDLFDIPVTTATIAFGLMTGCFGFANILVTHALLPRFGARTVVLAGTCLATVSVAATSLAPNMLFVTVTHCFIGVAHALMYAPSVTLLGHYFNARRSFAMAVANTGISVSALIFAPLTQYLITSFGTHGALLLVAGIQMQGMVAACLLRPVSFYTRHKRPPGTARGSHGGRSSDGIDPGDDRKTGAALTPLLQRNVSDGGAGGRADASGLERKEARVGLLDGCGGPAVDAGGPRDLPSGDGDGASLLSSSLPGRWRPCAEPERHFSQQTLSRQNQALTVTSSRTYAPRRGSPSEMRIHSCACCASLTDLCAASSVNVTTVTLPISSKHGGRDHSETEDESSDSRGCSRRCLSVMANIFDLSLFKNWLFLMIIAYLPFGLCSGFFGFYFPSLGVSNGLSRPDAALLMTVVGAVDLISRLCLGYLADLNLVKRTHLVAICMALVALAAQFTRFYTNFGLLAMFAVFYGLFGGACQNLMAVVIIDLLGLAQLGKAMGLVLLGNAVFVSFTHPIIGALADLTGSFVVPFSYVGACVFTSAAILLLEPLARRLQAARSTT